MITEAKDDIKKKLDEVERDAEKIHPSPADEENINELIFDLKKLKNDLVLRYGFLKKEAEDKKLAPRPSLPTFDGSISRFFMFQAEYDAATKHYNDREKLTNYKQAFVGPKSDALKDLLIGITSYAEAVNILKSQFATESMIPTLQQEVLNLPAHPDTAAKENLNINKMLNYYNLLRIHDKVHSYSNQLIQIARQKLTVDNCNILYKQHVTDDKNCVPSTHRLQPFIEFLQELRRINNMKLIETSTGSKTATRNIVSKAHQVQGSPRCNICSQGHLTSKCQDLDGKSNSEKKTFLISKKVCTTCLQPYTSNHKAACKNTFRTGNGQWKQKLCSCGSRLNNLICSCKNPSRKNPPPQASLTSSITPTDSSGPNTVMSA